MGNLPLRKSVVKCKSYQSSFASFWKLMLPSTSPNEKKKKGKNGREDGFSKVKPGHNGFCITVSQNCPLLFFRIGFKAIL